MKKDDFKNLFKTSVEIAIVNAEAKLGIRLSRNIKILISGWEPLSPTLTLDEAFEEIFISESSFFRIIDLGVIRFSNNSVSVAVRHSDHKPSEFEDTWNQPFGSGPFKQIIFEEIESQ